ncbi:MAG TPA: ethanolamine ammonia-lyase reactivating factor EutA [Candidatus Limnocylindria bacterium]|nr:ethanolamine ammonia-lyase reactivating factor EutA [Candidatus Limnocylindria bacterium]
MLRTVGIDIGSTTSHSMFARLRLQRLADSLSSRYVVVEREVLHRSPIVLTPYAAGDTIDAAALEAHIARWYADAGLTRDDVDTGAVILTGTALESHNARQLAELFSGKGGKFVCATAGHALEATLAAHGSGSVARSRRAHETILHVDIGGGTTKLARIEDGVIVATTAVAAGARLVAFDERGRIARIEPAARSFGVPLTMGATLTREQRERLAASMADVIVTAIRGGDVAKELRLLDPLKRSSAPARIALSGGVSEYVSGRERTDHDDLGRELAAALVARRDKLPAPLAVATDGIRATVIGASQFTVQVSGSTIGLGAQLPLRNVPVVRLGAAMHGSGALALAVKWDGEPEHARIRALAERIARATDRRPLIVATDGDIAATLGTILRDELRFTGELITLDGLELGDLDYIDVGAPLPPSGVVPVVVKSLVFSEGTEPART